MMQQKWLFRWKCGNLTQNLSSNDDIRVLRARHISCLKINSINILWGKSKGNVSTNTQQIKTADPPPYNVGYEITPTQSRIAS